MNKIKVLKKKYDFAKKANVGDIIECPSCGTKFEKKHHQTKFCKTKGGTVCKDYYWNNVTPEKRNNTTRISPSNARWRAKREEMFNPDNYEHPFSSEALGQW